MLDKSNFRLTSACLTCYRDNYLLKTCVTRSWACAMAETSANEVVDGMG